MKTVQTEDGKFDVKVVPTYFDSKCPKVIAFKQLE